VQPHWHTRSQLGHELQRVQNNKLYVYNDELFRIRL
jgi:hypothetical protein